MSTPAEVCEQSFERKLRNDQFLGTVPLAWSVGAFRHYVQVREGQVDPQAQGVEDMMLIAPNHIESGTGRLLGIETASDQSAESGKYWCDRGDVIYSKIRPALKKVALAPQDCLCSADMYPLKGRNGLTNRFLFWYLLSEQFSDFALRESARVAMPKLNRETLAAAMVPIPGAEEQTRIANFLDTQTARIDALIAEKELLFERLIEYRLSLLEGILTGSGASSVRQATGSWVDKVPANWSLPRNKEIFVEVDDRSQAGDEELLTVSHLTGVTRRSDKTVNMFLAESMEGYKRCHSNDLVINTMWAWMGAMGISPLDGIVSPSYNVYRVRDPSRLLPAYFELVCRSPAHIGLVKSLSTGVWESRLRLYPDAFLNIRTPLPPTDEQAQIVSLVGAKLQEVDALLTCIPSSLALLREYRSSLISAAVTGQLDLGAFKAAA